MPRFATRQELISKTGATATHSIPAGGLTNQILRKTSGTDYETAWANHYGMDAAFAAAPTGNLAVDGPALQALIDAKASDNVIFLRSGSYALRELNYDGSGGLRLIGTGSTQFNFYPTTHNQSNLTIQNGSTISSHNWIEGIKFYSGDTLYDKAGLKIIDGSVTVLRDLRVGGYGGSGRDSVGIHIEGREGLYAENLDLSANIPLRLAKLTHVNADGQNSLDHYTFNNLYITGNNNTTNNLHKAAVLIDDGVHGLNLKFTGNNGWVLLGGDGLYWRLTAVHDYCGTISIENVRTEQPTSTSQWSIYLDHYSGDPTRNVALYNCELSTNCNGLYARNCEQILVSNCSLSGLSGRTLMDADGFRSLCWENVRTAQTGSGSVNVNGATQHWVCPETATWDHPHNCIWGD